MASVNDKLTSFINENFIMGRGDVDLKPDDSFIETGIMDSTGILELVTYIEEEFSITIEDEELVPENLDSINNLIAFLKTKGVK